ncbi:DUF1203 domain-containing protein [Rhizobiales bacterium]|uniref:DUF1203 domain-containing protein n=1 Tax=Hongsoonwoonella zoysiae TaxID=2821844 RepID=UPI001560FBD4|nr:DUF1203 domain-containing protein [Hongsoonwoonella zoysiae]NRG19340.1 DUF1203 domain-containing protein [Hongsoonwoonella zoysiae]
MPKIRFQALPTEIARHYRNGGKDANGHAPERHISDGGGNPCRHCLKFIPEGAPFLILSHRPFDEAQPYAEVGPIFLCAEDCERHPDAEETPEMFLGWEHLNVRGYGADNRIVYGTGKIVPTGDVSKYAAELLAKPEIAYVHLRSASNNCYQARIERDEVN